MDKKQILVHADELVEQLKQLEVEKVKFKEIAEERMRAIGDQLDAKLAKLDSNASFIEIELLEIAKNSDTKETKTQHKLELLSGDVIIKKATTKFKNDNKAILEAIKDSRKDLVKERTSYTLDWAGFKKELAIVDGTIVNKATGEIVDVAGLEVEDVPERVEIK